MTERRHADAELDAMIAEGERAMVERIAALVRVWGGARDPEATAFVAVGLVEGSVHAHVLGHPVVEDERFRDALVEAVTRVALPPRHPGA